MGVSKGSAFERRVCKELSLWWSGGERDDLLWRTAASGGRATVRSKAGKSNTSGGYGDITSTDPRSRVLTRVFAFELKKGYNKYTVHDLIDRTDRTAVQAWELWVRQAARSAEQAKALTWALIHKRDQREAVIALPVRAYSGLTQDSPYGSLVPPFIGEVPDGDRKPKRIVLMRLSTFLDVVTPTMVRAYWSENRAEGK